MFEAVGHPVIDLIRLRFGPIALGDLAAGDMRPANDRERKALAVIENEARSSEERA
jgi:23S rRNA pseudouridine2605 synthase